MSPSIVSVHLPNLQRIYDTVSKYSIIPTLKVGGRISSFMLLAYTINDYILMPEDNVSDLSERNEISEFEFNSCFTSFLRLLSISEDRTININMVMPLFVKTLSTIPEEFFSRADLERFITSRNPDQFNALFQIIRYKHSGQYKTYLANRLHSCIFKCKKTLRFSLEKVNTVSEWIDKYKELSSPKTHLGRHSFTLLKSYYQDAARFNHLKKLAKDPNAKLDTERSSITSWAKRQGFPDNYMTSHTQETCRLFKELVRRYTA
jgi:hypothetical protein